MGYAPPAPPAAAELIRRDLEPTLTHLYNIFETAYNRDAAFPLPGGRSYREYVEGLYGPQRRDWFPFLNAAAVVSSIALVVSIVWALL